MKKMKILISLAAVMPVALAQTTTTNCSGSLGQVNCTSHTQKSITDSVAEATRQLQESRQRQREDAQHREQLDVMRAQLEQLRIQNELLRLQLEPGYADRVAEEIKAMRQAWDRLVEQEAKLPSTDRIPPHLLSRMAINEASGSLGRKPLDQSVESFRRQIGLL